MRQQGKPYQHDIAERNAPDHGVVARPIAQGDLVLVGGDEASHTLSPANARETSVTVASAR